MKNILKIVSAFIVMTVVGVLIGAVYVVSETNQVVITQFGKPVGDPITTAGLHFKVPIIQHLHYFDKRLLVQDGDPNQIPTRDKKYIWVDTTARWKIDDSLKFLQSVGSERGAYSRLDDIINSATRDVITKRPLVEIIRDSNRVLDEEGNAFVASFDEEALAHIKQGREAMEGDILVRAQKLAPQYGIKLVDVRIKHVNYVENVRQKVYERMISERKRAAEEYRSEGRGKSAEIQGRMEKELKSITSGAYKTAETVRGEADAKTTIIYAEAYNNDPDFYDFMKTMETYRNSMGAGTTVLLTTDSEYFRYLKKLN